MSTDPIDDDLTSLIAAAIAVAQDADLTHYLRWNYVRLANKLFPVDYTDEEMMAMNALMAQALSRKLALLGTGDPVLDPLIGVLNAQVRRRPALRLVD